MYKRYYKRIFDIVFSFIVLLILSPLILIISVVLAISVKGSPFFLQYRPGKNMKIFRLIKFKTMTDECDSQGLLLPDKLRITYIGSRIRSASLDEILQLLNVLTGSMSLVGPRPLLIEYLPLYNEEQRKRHEVKPGITGWAQVNGRNAISWEMKFKLDIWYVENISFFLDLKILLLTVIKSLRSDDINASEDVTMEKFLGNK